MAKVIGFIVGGVLLVGIGVALGYFIFRGDVVSNIEDASRILGEDLRRASDVEREIGERTANLVSASAEATRRAEDAERTAQDASRRAEDAERRERESLVASGRLIESTTDLVNRLTEFASGNREAGSLIEEGGRILSDVLGSGGE